MKGGEAMKREKWWAVVETVGEAPQYDSFYRSQANAKYAVRLRRECRTVDRGWQVVPVWITVARPKKRKVKRWYARSGSI